MRMEAWKRIFLTYTKSEQKAEVATHMKDSTPKLSWLKKQDLVTRERTALISLVLLYHSKAGSLTENESSF